MAQRKSLIRLLFPTQRERERPRLAHTPNLGRGAVDLLAAGRGGGPVRLQRGGRRRAGGGGRGRGGPDDGPGHAARLPSNLELRGGDGDPLVSVGLEPGESQVVAAVEVGVLAVREPPAALVVLGAVGVRGVAVAVRRRELHAGLVVERVGGVAAVAGDAEAEAVVARRDHRLVVLGQPPLAVDVTQLDAQLHAAVRRQPVQRLVSEPKFACKHRDEREVSFRSATA